MSCPVVYPYILFFVIALRAPHGPVPVCTDMRGQTLRRATTSSFLVLSRNVRSPPPIHSTAELTPIPVARAAQPPSPRSVHSSLRGRVEQQVDAIAGSANKVISGVVDSSFGVLRALLPGTPILDAGAAAPGEGNADAQEAAPWNASRPGFGLLRRDTGFSIANLTAALPGASKPKKDEEAGQQLLEVPSRPGSSRSMRIDDTSSSAESEEDDEDEEEDEEEYEEEGHDTRSIRSFESMMSARSARAKRKGRQRINSTASGRKSLADRLASVPGLSRLSGTQGVSHDTSKVINWPLSVYECR